MIAGKKRWSFKVDFGGIKKKECILPSRTRAHDEAAAFPFFFLFLRFLTLPAEGLDLRSFFDSCTSSVSFSMADLAADSVKKV